LALSKTKVSELASRKKKKYPKWQIITKFYNFRFLPCFGIKIIEIYVLRREKSTLNTHGRNPAPAPDYDAEKPEFCVQWSHQMGSHGDVNDDIGPCR
jgi:hypothetical protein